MRVTRRTFLKIAAASAAALGLTRAELLKLTEVLSKEGGGAPKVMWIQGQNCTGCTTAFANLEWDGNPEGLPAEVSTYLGNVPTLEPALIEPDNKTTLDDVLLDIIDLNYLQTIMATGGEGAWQILKDAMVSSPGFSGGVLIVEGAIPTNNDKYCTVGHSALGSEPELFVGNVVADIANAAKGHAAAVIAAGTCASFGGIPGANSDPARPKTGAMSVESYLQLVGVTPPLGTVVKVPGCNINPDWLFGTVVHYILGDLVANLDDYGRPKFYYGSTNHGGRCLRYQAYCDGKFARWPSDDDPIYGKPLCLAMIGCKGFSTYADCAFGGPGSVKGRGWNVYSRDAARNPTSGNSCINNGYPCMGCTEKAFPDRFSPFFRY